LRIIFPTLLVLVSVLAALSPPAGAADVFASIGTGEINGVYYPVGRAICDVVNRDLSITGVRCSAEATPG
jgi:uncharacterized protein